MKKSKTLISIITVVYNGEKHIEQTIKSVINQSYENIEYIIVDGNSTDGTIDIIKKYEGSISKWISEKDDGIYYAMNKGIKLATGDFIAFINADDWYEKDILKTIASIIDENDNIDFFYGDLNFIKTDGDIVVWKGNRSFKGLEIPHPTIFIRSEVFKKKLFNTRFKIIADAELTLNLFNSGIKSLYTNELISNFRDGGVSSNFWTTQKEGFMVLVRYIGFGYALKSFFKKSIYLCLEYKRKNKMKEFIRSRPSLYGFLEKLLNYYEYTLYKVSSKKGVLVYVGLHKGRGFDREVYKHELSFGFEANPELFKELQKKYSKYKNVFIINAAVADYDGIVDFNISNNGGESSSIGNFDENWNNNIKMEKTISVKCINLNNFLKDKDIDFINHYISDIQGMDLTVLKTLKPLIDAKKIGCITSEVTKNENGNIYSDLPDNSELGFEKLLNNHYILVSKGAGVLKDGEFKEVPDGWWEMDCRWCLRKDK